VLRHGFTSGIKDQFEDGYGDGAQLQSQGRTTMKFRVNYRITDQDKWLPVLKKWSSLSPDQRGNDAGGR
jgi:hypothetical protein